MRRTLFLVPGIAIFVYLVLSLPEPSPSGLAGTLAISVAFGAIAFYFFNAPHGKRDSETAFGTMGKYLFPVYGTIIPRKVMIWIFGSVLMLLSLAALLYHLGY